jgi:hypothetical protein
MEKRGTSGQFTLFLIILLPLFVFSCKDKGGLHVPDISGSTGEMLIVMNDSVKNNVGGHKLLSVMRQTVIGLPQAEQLFDVSVIPHRAFSERLRSFRNLVVVKVGADYASEIKYYKGQWGKQQAMAHVFARNSWELDSLLAANEVKLAGFFVRAERDRSQKYYRKYISRKLTGKFQGQWGAFMIVPINYEENNTGKDFMWLSHETPLVSLGLLVYSFEYTGPESITKSYLLNKRDAMLKNNVPGPAQGSYMATESRLPVTYKYFKHNDHQVVELRGLWKVNGDLMGGPFVSFAHIDQEKSRVVVTDGYVYAPEKPEKRNLIWQIESILYSFRFIDEKEEE